MKYKTALLGTCVVVLLLLVAGTLWKSSERQYVTITNLGLRLKVLQQAILSKAKFEQKSWPSWEMIWKPMLASMQTEAQRAVAEEQGIHISEAMYQQLSRFAGADIGGEDAFKNVASQLDFPDAEIKARLPVVFSGQEQQASMYNVDRFREEIAGILSKEAGYLDWLSPILYEQRLRDRAVACKVLMEISAFKAYSDRLRSRCANASPRTKSKWKACSGEGEPIVRQMRELQVTSAVNLEKFKSRWPVKDGEDICSVP